MSYVIGERIEFKSVLPLRIKAGTNGEDQSFATEHWQKGHVVAHDEVLYDVKDDSGLLRSVPEYKIRAFHLSEMDTQAEE